jgi:DNA invertase Pin-like site-specific DNA recombinase
MSKFIPAVIYARYSSSRQREESIVGQLRECHEYADRKDMKIIHEYTDEELTGTNDHRPGFQKMIRDASKGIFKVVLVWKIDRFARDHADSAMYRKILQQKHGVTVISIHEDFGTGAITSITGSLFEGIAEYYSRNLSENVIRGNTDSALEHKTLGVRVYGYRKGHDGKFEIDPVESEIVKRIYREYVSGKKLTDIYADLNREGIMNGSGRPWVRSSTKIILTSERYIGVYKFGSYRCDGGMPAIIDKDTFEAAQEIKETHRRRPNLKENVYLLSGKLFCGICGQVMTGEYAIGEHGHKYEYYACTGKRNRSCNKKRVSKTWVEDAVIGFLVSQLQDEGIIEQIVDGFMKWQQEETLKDSDLQIIHAKQKENERQLQQIKAAILKAPASDTLIKMLMDNETTRDKLSEAEKKEILKQRPKLSRADLCDWLSELSAGDCESPSFRKQLVNVFLDKVFLNDDGTAVMSLNLGTTAPKEVTVEIAGEALAKSSTLSLMAGLYVTSPNIFIDKMVISVLISVVS